VRFFASGDVQARTAGNRAVAVLLLGSAVRSCLIINPVLLRVGHSATTGNRARRSGLVERAGKRTVAEGLGSVAPPRGFSGSAHDRKSRAHSLISIDSPTCPKPRRLECGCRSLVRTALSFKFPDRQGKYREIRDFRPIQEPCRSENPAWHLGFFMEFPGDRNREFEAPIRESQFPDLLTNREFGLLFRAG